MNKKKTDNLLKFGILGVLFMIIYNFFKNKNNSSSVFEDIESSSNCPPIPLQTFIDYVAVSEGGLSRALTDTQHTKMIPLLESTLLNTYNDEVQEAYNDAIENGAYHTNRGVTFMSYLDDEWKELHKNILNNDSEEWNIWYREWIDERLGEVYFLNDEGKYEMSKNDSIYALRRNWQEYYKFINKGQELFLGQMDIRWKYIYGQNYIDMPLFPIACVVFKYVWGSGYTGGSKQLQQFLLYHQNFSDLGVLVNHDNNSWLGIDITNSVDSDRIKPSEFMKVCEAYLLNIDVDKRRSEMYKIAILLIDYRRDVIYPSLSTYVHNGTGWTNSANRLRSILVDYENCNS